MSEPDTGTTTHPRETFALFGHADAERTLLESYRSGRIPHAWLIGGAQGVGKATLAYRMARFVLAHPDPAAGVVQQASSLEVDPDNSAARRIAAEAHPGLLVVKRELNEKTDKLFTEIRVDDVRRAVPFFGSTAGEGDWRVAIVDSVDELNRAGANALLKILEEPPERALLFLISHAPGRVLPTIRSRCRLLSLRPLDASEVAQAVAVATHAEAGEAAIDEVSKLAEGSVARALALLNGPALALRKQVIDLLAQLPEPDPRALHSLGDALAGTEPQKLAAFLDVVNGWLASRLRAGSADTSGMARVAEAWERINQSARDVETYNLERKPLVFAVFGLLAAAARG
ncbi:MAG: DNA polymerase III subunit delta' [Pseudolabrys sp.]|nr:DNA polymerase III subunit delta' [Pseudolabrys sp.]